MRVDEKRRAEEGVERGVERAGGERRYRQGDQRCGHESVEGPVVGAVRRGGLWYGRRVVDCGGG